MINSVQGMISALSDRSLTLTLGAFEISVLVAHTRDYMLGTSVKLQTYLHWHQENGPQLFGFRDVLERELFLMIIDCSGIGPKLALALLDELPVATLIHAVQTGDHKILSSVSGIGPKKAEHVAVQLRHKIDKLLESHPVVQDPAVEHWHTLSQTLQSLQYGRSEINAALQHLKTSGASTIAHGSFDVLLRQALQFLSKQP
jgi:holliday junction DNA helicase RuvA